MWAVALSYFLGISVKSAALNGTPTSLGDWSRNSSNEIGEQDWSAKFFEIIDRLPDDSQVFNVDFH